MRYCHYIFPSNFCFVVIVHLSNLLMLCNLYKFKMYIDLNATPLIITNNYWLESMPI